MKTFFTDKYGQTIVSQKPNWSISIAAGFWILQFIFADGLAHAVFRSLFLVFLGYWAYLELTDGVNTYRRILGLIVLVFVTIQAWQNIANGLFGLL